MKIAVDVMGTDYGPAEIIKGVLQAVSEYGCDVVLVGDQEVIRRELAREHQENNPRVTIHHASQVIEMQDHPGISVKKRRMPPLWWPPISSMKRNVTPWCLPAVPAPPWLPPCSAWAGSGASNGRPSPR